MRPARLSTAGRMRRHFGACALMFLRERRSRGRSGTRVAGLGEGENGEIEREEKGRDLRDDFDYSFSLRSRVVRVFLAIRLEAVFERTKITEKKIKSR